MSTAGSFDATPITGISDLAGWLEAGCKPKSAWRIGVEHEKFGFTTADYRPLPFEGPGASIAAVFDGLTEFGWSRLIEDGRTVGMARNGATIALEPGGQFELSGAPLETLHETCDEVNAHLAEVRAVTEPMGVRFIGIGATPTWSLDDMPRVPKARYDIMRGYMPKVGGLGHDMMHRTCTVQVNLDFSSEADMVKKLRVALALQPLATALFANSPFLDSAPNGYLSYRAHVWTDTDADRTGMLPFVFEGGFGFEAYAAWAASAPMYFIRREGRFIDVAGAPFSTFLEGRLPGFEGERPSIGDWVDHLSTLFPEARIKRFLEMRGADSGPWSRLCALPALWVGLIYDDAALEAAWRLCAPWTGEDRGDLRRDAAKIGLKAQIGGRSLQDIARDVLDIAADGLAARRRPGETWPDETGFLKPLEETVVSGRTPADAMLAAYHGAWAGDLTRVYADFSY